MSPVIASLTPIERALLRALLASRDRVVTRRQLFAAVYPGEVFACSHGWPAVHVRNMRRKGVKVQTARKSLGSEHCGYYVGAWEPTPKSYTRNCQWCGEAFTELVVASVSAGPRYRYCAGHRTRYYRQTFHRRIAFAQFGRHDNECIPRRAEA